MKMNKERNDLEWKPEKNKPYGKSMKKRCKKKSSGWPRRRTKDRMSELGKKIVRPAQRKA